MGSLKIVAAEVSFVIVEKGMARLVDVWLIFLRRESHRCKS